MNKRIKRIISSTVIITAMSVTGININAPIGSIEAYAASYKLTKLDMSGANLYENTNYTKELDNKSIKDTYYAKLSSDRSKVSIDAETEGESYISITKQGSSKEYDPGDDITILTGKTTLRVTVYGSSEDKENKKNAKKSYKIIIKRYTKEEEAEIKNDTQDDIYLQTLELDYGDIPIGFRFNKMNYDVKIDPDIKSLAVKAVPDDGAYDVTINGLSVTEDDDYKKNVKIASTGTTKVEIALSYDDEEFRTYTINITKKDKNDEENTTVTDLENNKTETDKNGAASNNKVDTTVNNTTNSINNGVSNNTNSSINANQKGWVKEDQFWRYIDDYGNTLKNTWFYDRNYGKTYYFNNEGYMATGWQYLNDAWYYLDNSGAMVTGWCKLGTSWYYLDYDGKMKTGWFKDSDGKYYYFYTNGQMASNTTINGYKLGSNGAWINR